MSRFDLLMMPTVPVEPFDRHEIQPQQNGPVSDLSWLAWAPSAYPFNLTGQPAVSVPAGFTENGMPAGLQLVGRSCADHVALAVARDLERILPWSHTYSRKDGRQLC